MDGGPIPEENLKNIRSLATRFRPLGYEVILWTDNIQKQQKALFSSEYEDNMPPITIKHIDPIIDKAHEFWKQEMTTRYRGCNARDIFNITNLERAGRHNYAVVSDFLRYEILRQEGGIYLDSDDELAPSPLDSQPTSLPLKGLKIGAMISKNCTYFQGGNSLLASCPNHPFLPGLIWKVIYNYSHGLDSPTRENWRAPQPKGYQAGRRLAYTINSSGPGALGDHVCWLPSILNSLEPGEQLMFRRTEHLVDHSAFEVAPGTSIRTKSQKSWLGDFPRSFDDEEVLRTRNDPSMHTL